MLIEEATPILPHILADRAAAHALPRDTEYSVFEEREKNLVEHLCDKAQKCFDNQPTWRKQICGPGNTGRDLLLSFMLHWAHGWCKKHHIPYCGPKWPYSISELKG